MTRKSVVDLVSRSTQETEQLAERLGRAVRPGDVFALWGELGTGKTVFVRGLARGMDVRGPVASPTFVLVNEYEGDLPLYHVDFYRLEPSQISSVGWEEYLDLAGVVAIEWPERAGPALPAERVDVRLGHLGEGERSVRLLAHGARANELLEVIADAGGD